MFWKLKYSKGRTDIKSIINQVLIYPIAISYNSSIYVSLYLKAVKNDKIISRVKSARTKFSKIYKFFESFSINAILYGRKKVKIINTIIFISNHILLKISSEYII